MKTLVGVLLWLSCACAGVASAQPEPLRAGEERRFFVVDKSGAPVFGTSDAAAPEPGREAALGDFFFALEETPTRVLVAQYPPVREVGWMRKADLLEQRTHALRVSEGVAQGLQVESVDLDGALNASNVLFLRVVTQPERRVALRGRPGGEAGAGEKLDTWRWFYAYDLEKVGGRTWVLLGERPRMLAGWVWERTDEGRSPPRASRLGAAGARDGLGDESRAGARHGSAGDRPSRRRRRSGGRLRQPAPAVGALVARTAGVLLVRRVSPPGGSHGPGGSLPVLSPARDPATRTLPATGRLRGVSRRVTACRVSAGFAEPSRRRKRRCARSTWSS